jgi:hypothetical protein
MTRSVTLYESMMHPKEAHPEQTNLVNNSDGTSETKKLKTILLGIPSKSSKMGRLLN